MLGLVFLCSSYRGIEPSFLLPLGVSEFKHESIKKIGMTNKKTEVVIRPAGVLAQLGSGRGGNEVGL